MQVLRHVVPMSPSPIGSWQACTISVLSTIFIVIAAVLSILFPAVELPPVKGPFNVGVVELYLPVEFPSKDTKSLPVRLLYPTGETKSTDIPYLNVQSAVAYCHNSMRIAAPPPMNKLGWILHTWRLTRLKVRRSAPLAETSCVGTETGSRHNGAVDEQNGYKSAIGESSSTKFPVVVYSHGLVGHADVYSYQTVSLAAQGYIVLVLTHSDGSSPAVRLADGTILPYDSSTAGLSGAEYLQARRQGTDYRVNEMIAATEAFIALNSADANLSDLFSHEAIPSFRDRLDLDELFFMGHSYGACTALTAAHRRPELVRAVVAHEPASDWLPDDARVSLLDTARWFDLSDLRKTYAEYGYFLDDNGSVADSGGSSIHDLEMLFLFSDEWSKKRWMYSDIILEMYKAHRLGPNTKTMDSNDSIGEQIVASQSANKSTKVLKRMNSSLVDVIESAHHNEFSDSSMMMPLWLSRSLGMTGPRSPLDTAADIAHRTRVFLASVRQVGKIQ
jgi:pimeloyl-ACP methyl ester carboxylesterase